MANIKSLFKRVKRKVDSFFFKDLEEDLYLKRLRSLVIGEGMLHEGNPYLINHAIAHMPENGIVLEIGSYGGLSTNLMLYLMRKHQRANLLFTCDPWIYGGYINGYHSNDPFIDGRTDVSRDAYGKYLKQAFIQGIQFLNGQHLPHSFQYTSDEFFEMYRNNTSETDVFGNKAPLGKAISFAYIDGNHDWEFVERDFENVHRLLLSGGFILFDDSIDGTDFGSARFMQVMMQHPAYKLVAKNPNYLFIKQ